MASVSWSRRPVVKPSGLSAGTTARRHDDTTIPPSAPQSEIPNLKSEIPSPPGGAQRAPLEAWFRLFRLPNLLTVPGDPIAGFLIASAGHVGRDALLPMLAAAAASVCLYMFGLAVNDIVDVETDRAERPDRPLPSGQITLPQAKMAAFAVLLSGLNISLIAGKPALYVAVALAVMILAYNIVLKKVFVAGVCAMGLCRGLSLLLGVAATQREWFTYPPRSICGTVYVYFPAVFAAVAVMAYVAAFSAIAKNEMAAEKPMGKLRWLPFVALLVGLPSVLISAAALKLTQGVMPNVFVFLMCMAVLRAWMLGGTLYRLQPVPQTIGGHIRNLLQIQACLCVAAGTAGFFPALFLMSLWLLFPRLSKHFYSS